MNSDELNNLIKQGAEQKIDFSNDTERCLWLAGIGNWEESHDIVESLPEPDASWVHAMLHREEGDLGNAGYWYHRAGKPIPDRGMSLKEEWIQIAKELLG